MTKLSYCPHCGQKGYEFLDDKKWYCPHCHFTLYHNVASAVAVLIESPKGVLLCQRNKEPQRGLWDLPGGFVDPFECAEEACQRELFEELGLQINKEDFVYRGSRPNTYYYKDILYKTCDLFFTTLLPSLNNEILTLQKEELSDYKIIPKDQINLDEIAFDSIRELLRGYVKD